MSEPSPLSTSNMAIKIVAVLAFCAVASGQVLLRPSAYGRPLAYGAGPYLRGVAAAPYLGGIAAAPYLGGITAAPYLGSAAPTPIAVARAPVQPQLLRREDAEYDPNPQYEYNYSVDDAVTGDSKSAQESRNGDNVQGSYSLIEPDGSRRIVEYTADPVNGFNAVVHKEGLGAPAPRTIAPAPVAIARTAPVIAPAPILAPRTIIGARPILRATAAPIYSNSFSSPYAQYAL